VYSFQSLLKSAKSFFLLKLHLQFLSQANRSQKLDDNAAQYSVTAELSGLVGIPFSFFASLSSYYCLFYSYDVLPKLFMYHSNIVSTYQVISLDEVQLQQMFLVWDYVCTCRLREK